MESTNRKKRTKEQNAWRLFCNANPITSNGIFNFIPLLHYMKFLSSIGLRESKFYHCLPFCCYSCPVNYWIGIRKDDDKKMEHFLRKLFHITIIVCFSDQTFFHPLFKLNNWFFIFFSIWFHLEIHCPHDNKKIFDGQK